MCPKNTSLERRYIKLSNGVQIMDLSQTQPNLLDADHAWGRMFQTEKNKIEYVVNLKSSVLLLFFLNKCDLLILFYRPTLA